jgi:putative RNA 2'-phosphotransferase
MRRFNNRDLSKTVSHALRHEPWVYELELDDEGWVSISQLLESLRSIKVWSDLAQSDVEQMIASSAKQRHEISGDRIRAIYGHSVPGKLSRAPATPPEVLFHGTNLESIEAIKTDGLQPMMRQNVHLSLDEETAIEVGKRKTKTPVLLRVRSREASENGVAFYLGNDKVWLADEVPSRFIEL